MNDDASWERKLLVDGIDDDEIELVLQNSILLASSEDDQSIASVLLVRNDDDTGRKVHKNLLEEDTVVTKESVIQNGAISQTSSAETTISKKREGNKDRILLYYKDNSKDDVLISYDDRTTSEEGKEEDEREPQENERVQTPHDHRQEDSSRSIDSFTSISITINNMDAEETTHYEENERDAPVSTSGMTSHPSMLVLTISDSSPVLLDEESSYHSSAPAPNLVQSDASREDCEDGLSFPGVDSDSTKAVSPSLSVSPSKQTTSPSQQKPKMETKIMIPVKSQVRNDHKKERSVEQEHESKHKNSHEETTYHNHQSIFARIEELYLMGREKIRSDLKKQSTEKLQTKFSIITSATSTTTTSTTSSNDNERKTTINVTLPSSARINQLYIFGKEKVRLDRERYICERIPPKKFAFGTHADNDMAGLNVSTTPTTCGTAPPSPPNTSAVLVLALPLSARINELYLIGREKIRTDLKRFLKESLKLKGRDF